MQDNRVIRSAFVISLLLHLVLVAATWRLPIVPHLDPAEARELNPDIELILVPEEQLTNEEDDFEPPRTFTEVPERQAVETPPENPDYLATYHSLAADTKLGEDSDTPSAEEEWLFDKVRIQKEELEGADGVVFTQQPPPSATRITQPTAGDEGEQDRESLESDDAERQGGWDLANPSAGRPGEEIPEPEESTDDPAESEPELEEWWGAESPSILKEGNRGAVGDRGFDFNQAAKGQVASGVAFHQDYSLNTWQWEWGPWMQKFINELHRVWIPPWAYRLGILDGHTVLKLVVARSGAIQSLEVVETEGHQSLHDASAAALRAFAPYAPLPPHFPEENLVITLGLYYPALRR